MGVPRKMASIANNPVIVPLSSLWRWFCHFHAHLLHMTITLCNSHPFTFYLPFHTSLSADQCPIHVPSTCTLGLDPCTRHSLFWRTDPYYIDNFFSSCGLKRPAATLSSPLLCNCTFVPVPLSTGPYLDANVHTRRRAAPQKWNGNKCN